ncbi:MAG: serine/threonine-protein kinase [Deltaproteobacteria bacterium]
MVAPESPLDEEEQSPLVPGQILVGKYRVERQIGRGGMGIVLAATHLQLEHLVAIKVLRRDLVADDKALSRLLSEARAAAKIRSEHVARVLDVGTLETGSPFIVMEYLDGEDLADLLDRQGALDVTQAVLFMLQSCEALAEVHAAEMVHRDLKPGNLFVAKRPDGSSSLKIVDFGISKHIGGSARNQAATTSAQVLGSPYYMPPEQMRAEPVDERSDIWSLGAILFEMLTARPPFLGDTLPEVYAAVLSQSAPTVESLRPGIPAGLDDIVQRCLDKDPAQRFCDVADLAEALAPFGGATSAQSVERITRILTNPELFHARSSNLSKAAPAPELPSAAGTARGGIGMYREPALAGTPVVEVGSASALSSALVTPAVSRAHRAGTSSPELGPLSATGSLADLEPPAGSRGARSAWAALAVLTLLVGGGLWLARSPEPLSHPAAAPLPLVGAPYRDSAPAGKDESTAAAPAPASPVLNAGKLPELQTRSQALKPGAVRPAPISVESFRAVLANRNAPAGDKSDKEKADRDKKPKGKAPKAPAAPSKLSNGPRPEPRPGSASPAPAAPGPAPRREAAGAREEDLWNPSSFGDRH